MPKDPRGMPLITFAVELDPNLKAGQYIWFTASKADTPQRIAASLGHPEKATAIKDLNGLRSITTKVGAGKRIRLPSQLDRSNTFTVHCDALRPTVKTGYAKFETVDRPGREGISRFQGYDPVALAVHIRFEGWIETPARPNAPGAVSAIAMGFRVPPRAVAQPAAQDAGAYIEGNIRRLEQMAGRPWGHDPAGAPQIIRLSTTDSSGKVLSLLPLQYQWSPGNPNAPLWQISNIEWDEDALSDEQGRRLRQLAVVEVTKFTPVTMLTRSASQRARIKAKAA